MSFAYLSLLEQRPSREGRDDRVHYELIGRVAGDARTECHLARIVKGRGRGRVVMLKRLLPELQSSPERVEDFLQEARTAARLVHKHVLQIYEIGELDGSLFIAMELPSGVTLRELLVACAQRGRTAPFEVAIAIACATLDALGHAHRLLDDEGGRAAVVHGGVAAECVAVTVEGEVKVSGFGAAAGSRPGGRREAARPRARGWGAKGRHDGGRSALDPDVRADVFAVGSLLWEMLAGHSLVDADTFVEARSAAVARLVPHLSPHLARGVGAVLVCALARDPRRRFADAREMLEALEDAVGRERASAASVGALVRELFPDSSRERAYVPGRDDRERGGADDPRMADRSRGPAASDSSPQAAPASDERTPELASVPARDDVDDLDARQQEDRPRVFQSQVERLFRDPFDLDTGERSGARYRFASATVGELAVAPNRSELRRPRTSRRVALLGALAAGACALISLPGRPPSPPLAESASAIVDELLARAPADEPVPPPSEPALAGAASPAAATIIPPRASRATERARARARLGAMVAAILRDRTLPSGLKRQRLDQLRKMLGLSKSEMSRIVRQAKLRR